MKKWFVYMLRCKGGSLYTGVTTDLDRRVAEHQSGKGAKYTRAHLPVVLVWSEVTDSESDAKKREAELKKLKKFEKEALI
ncbi:GIY-YIG nuclease family protein [Candidatus Uhrbacteria bacterium]|nr:GIY-YIG nuclease family protein [Candidatus Uhrbacteria bacterium]